MNNPDLKKLLKEYEQKRLEKEIAYEEKIDALYKNNPNLSKVVDNINKNSIELSKAILFKQTEKIDNLKNSIENAKKEKTQILNDLNIKDSFFIPDYDCKKCNDTGFLINNNNIMNNINMNNNSMCSCLNQKLMNIQYNKSNISNLNIENFDTFTDEYLSNTSDQKKFNSAISPREKNKSDKKNCIKFY